MRALVGTLCALALAACSGGDNDESPPNEFIVNPPPQAARGTLIESPPPRIASITAADLAALATSSPSGQWLLESIANLRCAVDVHQISYHTIDVTGAPATASGALIIPTGADPACQGPRPILTYAHGTNVERAFNIAEVTNVDNVEGLLMAVTFAARGYIVVAPNYVGLHTSSATVHPYLNADQQANDMADAIAAARSALPTSFAPTVTDSGKLFLTGYSQGGFVAMATHRLLQEIGVPVTASAPMSGPYAMAAFGDAVTYGQVVRSAPVFFAYAVTGYQRAYGDVYLNPDEVFEARYAATIETILPTTASRSQLTAQGLLPEEQLFSEIPPDPAFAPFTPATQPAELAHVFARGFGPDHLVTNAFRLAYLQDAQLNPDGGFPNVTDGLAAPNPANGLRRAFKANDLRNWTPTSPVLLCAGREDPTVLYLNTQLMEAYWTASGAPAVTVLDLESEAELDDPHATRKALFAAAKEAVALQAVANGATDGGVAAVSDAYHGALVAPFCLSAAQSFFDGL